MEPQESNQDTMGQKENNIQHQELKPSGKTNPTNELFKLDDDESSNFFERIKSANENKFGDKINNEKTDEKDNKIAALEAEVKLLKIMLKVFLKRLEWFEEENESLRNMMDRLDIFLEIHPEFKDIFAERKRKPKKSDKKEEENYPVKKGE